jgi:hypothetical protein
MCGFEPLVPRYRTNKWSVANRFNFIKRVCWVICGNVPGKYFIPCTVYISLNHHIQLYIVQLLYILKYKCHANGMQFRLTPNR